MAVTVETGVNSFYTGVVIPWFVTPLFAAMAFAAGWWRHNHTGSGHFAGVLLLALTFAAVAFAGFMVIGAFYTYA